MFGFEKLFNSVSVAARAMSTNVVNNTLKVNAAKNNMLQVIDMMNKIGAILDISVISNNVAHQEWRLPQVVNSQVKIVFDPCVITFVSDDSEILAKVDAALSELPLLGSCYQEVS